MKQFLLFLALAGTLSMNVNGQNAKKFELDGEVDMPDSGMLYLRYWSEGRKTLDSAKVRNGRFSFTGFILEPVSANLCDREDKMYLGYKNLYTDFFIAPCKMKVFLIKDHFPDAKLTGSKANEEFQLLNKMTLPLCGTISALESRIRNDSVNVTNRFDSLRLYKQKLKDSLLTFIRAHSNSVIGAKAIGYLGTADVNKDTIISMLNMLTEDIKSGYFVSWLKQLLKRPDAGVGNTAPDFLGKDINGAAIRLSALKKRYVLLDFWASWCIPCRSLTPDLKEWYSRYHSRGLEIISIAVGEKDSTGWRKAIDDDKVNDWYQILDAESVRRQKYSVGPIPDLVLIDARGIIIGRYSGTDEVKRKLGKKFGEIFGE